MRVKQGLYTHYMNTAHKGPSDGISWAQVDMGILFPTRKGFTVYEAIRTVNPLQPFTSIILLAQLLLQ